MSILAAGSQQELTAVLVMVIFCCGSIAASLWLGIFRQETWAGPSRVPSDQKPSILLMPLFGGFSAWLLSQTIYIGCRQHGLMHAHEPFNPVTFEPLDWAFLATAPAAAAFAMMVLVDGLVLGRAGMARLGLDRGALRGLFSGIVATLIAMPLVMGLSSIIELFYRAIHFQHPPEHDLLKQMGDASSAILKWSLIVGAVLCAPLFEELFFRAHVQTFLRATLIRLARRRVSRPAEDDVTDPASRQDDRLLTGCPLPPRTLAWATWISIVITSVLFSLVHPRWTWPPIFFLSICLGLAYERTGNLWTNIAMHAMFNGFQTVAYLLFVKG